jgi:hypothetical protein
MCPHGSCRRAGQAGLFDIQFSLIFDSTLIAMQQGVCFNRLVKRASQLALLFLLQYLMPYGQFFFIPFATSMSAFGR